MRKSPQTPQSWRLVVLAVVLLLGLALFAYRCLPDRPDLLLLATVVSVFIFVGVAIRICILPLRELLNALGSDSEKRFLRRASPTLTGEFAALGTRCNRLMERVTELSVQTIDQDRELRWAQERLMLQESLQRQLREKALLGELAETFSSSLDIHEVLHSVCKRVSEVLAIDEVAVVLYEPATQDLLAAAAYGMDASDAIVGLRFPLGAGITGAVWNEEPVVYIPDTSKDARFSHWQGRHHVGAASMVATRMEFGDDKLGFLDCLRRDRDAFLDDELRMLAIVAHQAAIAVRNAQTYKQTMELATHDELTGLLNRRRFMELLDAEWVRRRRYGGELSVMIADLDHFKSYNDTYGHLVGDQVLCKLALVIKESVRRVDRVARYGGEEFVVLVSGGEPGGALTVAEKLRQSVEKAELVDLVGEEGPSATISVGVAVTTPAESPLTALGLIEAADRALLQAKRVGRNRVVQA